MRLYLTIGLACGMLMAAQSASAKINYFTCQANDISGPYRVTTDDERGEVTYEVTSNGNIFKKPAIFTADSVVWGDPSSSSTRTQFTISRVDLSFSIDVFIGGKVITPRKGKCEKIEPPKRAF